jgi:ABC-type branched-subunit amino acid transport system substrate-binding protein
VLGVIAGFGIAIAADDVEGFADALTAKRLDAHRVFVLNDGPGYGRNIGAGFSSGARRLGLTIDGPYTWGYSARSYEPFVARAAALHPDAIFLGTFLAPETIRLIQELKTALPNVQLIAPDGSAASIS